MSSESELLLIFGAVLILFTWGFILFTIWWVLPKTLGLMEKDFQKYAENKEAALLFQPAAERMRGKDGEIMTWEFERRRDEVTARTRERLELAVDCSVTVKHLIGWQRQMRKRKKFFHWRSLLSWLWWPLTMLLLGSYGVLRGGWNWSLITLLFGSAVVALFYPRLRWNSIVTNLKALAKQKALMGVGLQRFLLTPASVIAVNEQTTAELPWCNVQRIDTEGAYTIFYLAPGWGWLFPKDAFASAEQYERFLVVAKECWERARPAEKEPQSLLLPLDPRALLPSQPSEDIRQ